MGELQPEDFGLNTWLVNRFDAVARKDLEVNEIVLYAEHISKEYADLIVLGVTAIVRTRENIIEVVFQRTISGTMFVNENSLGIVTLPLDKPIKLREHDRLIITISMTAWIARPIPLPAIVVALRGESKERE